MASQNNYVIGVDGGGTKTTAALADLRGKILKIGKADSSSPRNVGVEKAAINVAIAIKKILPRNKEKVLSIFAGLPAVQEEFSSKVEEIKKIISKRVKRKLTVGSDQMVAFRSGTNEKDGIMLIAGTGSVAHGWKGKKEYKASGWGWLADAKIVLNTFKKEVKKEAPKAEFIQPKREPVIGAVKLAIELLKR